MREEQRSRAITAGVFAVVLTILLAGCAFTNAADEGRSPATAVAGEKVGERSVMVVAAGDIARNPDDGRGTAKLIASIGPDAVLALGDNAYDRGTLAEYQRNFDPTWGRFKAITRPVPGNHEYDDNDGAGYYQYFRGQLSGDEYYAWNAGRWRMYALNCEIDCGRGSEQLTWLKQDLATHPTRPALAYVHEPRFTCSTHHPPETELSAVWSALQRGRGRIMLAAHNHAYERFARLDAQGRRSADGLRQFVVGTGGASSYPLRPSCPNRISAQDESFGVLKLRLRPDSYSWKFIAVDGRILDSGRGTA